MKVKFRPKGTYLNMTYENVKIIKEIQKLHFYCEALQKMITLDADEPYNQEVISKMYYTLQKVEMLYQDLERSVDCDQ